MFKKFFWKFKKEDDLFIYGICRGHIARKCKTKPDGNIQFQLNNLFWIDFDKGWWNQFKPNY